MAYSKEDILRLVEEEDVQFIRMQFVDVFGQLKNVAITASQLPRALDDQIMIDGSAIEGFVRVNESDQYLRPDLNTFAIYPWRPMQGKVARLLCNVYNPDGSPFVGDPRSVLRRVVSKAASMGLNLMIGPECEFFLFKTDDQGRPTTQPSDVATYFDLSPLDQGESTRREVCMALEKMGFEIEGSHHENAPGQHEIDFHYTEAMEAADQILTFRLAVKTLAQRNGLHATFMPKPIDGVNGSGMHINMSLFRNGKNLFYDPDGLHGLSKEAYSFIAGILYHIRGLCALTNPLVNSYKRLVPGYEAPCYITWSVGNRSSLVRIPEVRGQATRVELRSPDPCANPYLALAACLAAGLDGIERDMTPPAEVTENIYAMSDAQRAYLGIETLPTSLHEALEEMQKDSCIMDTLGKHVAKAYIEGKEKEWKEYRVQVSQWERDKYMTVY
ncbi:MAG: type I glutamate--ammonia ligase [Clostridiales bacterium]|nr:type I glutamate--ammonia ligase [Clostridiales bacterium]